MQVVRHPRTRVGDSQDPIEFVPKKRDPCSIHGESVIPEPTLPFNHMSNRSYYSTRAGRSTGKSLDLAALKRLFLAFYSKLYESDQLQEMLGKDCPDDPELFGVAGRDVESYVLWRVRKPNLWPLHKRVDAYTEDDLFDMIEFLYDHVSQGVDGYMHHHGGCGMRFSTFDRASARARYREAINPLLADYEPGYVLSTAGEIENLPEAGFANLVVAGLPSADPENVDDRVRVSVAKYLRRASTLEDRRDAVRGLADVLEYLRPQLKRVLKSKDEADLFNIANNFAVRHHNSRQQSNYDPNVWTSWMFYYFLATIHAAQRMIQRAGVATPRPG